MIDFILPRQLPITRHTALPHSSQKLPFSNRPKFRSQILPGGAFAECRVLAMNLPLDGCAWMASLSHLLPIVVDGQRKCWLSAVADPFIETVIAEAQNHSRRNGLE